MDFVSNQQWFSYNIDIFYGFISYYYSLGTLNKWAFLCDWLSYKKDIENNFSNVSRVRNNLVAMIYFKYNIILNCTPIKQLSSEKLQNSLSKMKM